MTQGKVKWYDEAKRFGFIETDDGEDIFVHQTGLLQPHLGLQAEQRVSFETKQGPKGLVAIEVKITE